ncbi:hypothetical protein E0K89_017715 [Aquicoccus sp. SCR17]|nr:hypothetical protein [Carideicomes alvinocaridis]
MRAPVTGRSRVLKKFSCHPPRILTFPLLEPHLCGIVKPRRVGHGIQGSRLSCGHCTAAIEKSVNAADPAASVTCDLGERRVTVDSALTPDRIGAAIRDAGYDPQTVAA